MMSTQLNSPASARNQQDDPKYLFSVEARDRIRRLPSTTPVPLFHGSNNGLPTSPAPSISTSVSSASSLPPAHLLRPQARSPHDVNAWEAAARHQGASTQPFSPAALGSYQQQLSSPYEDAQAAAMASFGSPLHHSQQQQQRGYRLSSLPSASSVPATPQSAPFFASLAKHAAASSLPHPSVAPASAYPRLPAAVSVYAEFDRQWMSTPLPKSLSQHPMAIAHAEASRRREEWEQRMRQQVGDWTAAAAGRGEEQQAEAADPVKKATAKLGKRPALPSRRSSSAVFSTAPLSASDSSFRTPVAKGRLKQQQAAASVSSSSQQKRRIAPMRVDDDEEAEAQETAAKTARSSISGGSAKQRGNASRRSVTFADTEWKKGEDGDETEDELTEDDEQQPLPTPRSRRRSAQRELRADEEEAEVDDSLAAADMEDATQTTPDADDGDIAAAVARSSSGQQPSPVKSRSSNRIYSPHTAAAQQPAAVASSSSSSSPVLKEDLSLTDWFLHCRLDAALRARLICKGTNSAGEPWVSGYVTARLQPRLLLTKSRRYRLQGRMDDEEMQREGWSSDSRAAFRDGLPVDWETTVEKEMLRKRQEEDGDEEQEAEAETQAVSGRKQREERKDGKDESAVQQPEPSASLISRPRRSPAPVKLWKSSEWSEAELLRLVEAQLELDGAKDGRQLWASVAGALGNGRTGEECRRKFEEFKREQQTTIAHAAQQQTEREAKADDDEVEEDNNDAEEAESDSDDDKQRSEDEKEQEEEERVESDEAKEEKAKQRPKQPRARKPSSSATSQTRKTTKKKPKPPQPQPQRRRAPEQQTAKSSKLASRSPARPSPRTPLRIADAPMSHLAVSSLAVARAVSRRSGRAVMAPLRYWELEREVNGVVVRGWDIDDLQYRRAREEVERSQRQMRQEDDGDDGRAAAAREEGRERRRAAAGKWRQEEKALLWSVYRELEPTTPFFWSEVSRRLGGWRSAEDCQKQLQQMFPTPKKRGKRKQTDRQPQQQQVDEAGLQPAAAEAEAAGVKRKRKRATTRKREIRQALEARDAEHGGDDLFNSTPFKNDSGLAAAGADSNTAAAASSSSSQLQQRGAVASSSRPALPASEQEEEEEAGVVFAGDPSLADVTVQRVVKDRRRVRAQVGAMLVAEKRRRREAAALQDEEEEDERSGLQRLEQERQERRQQAEDEMHEDSAAEDEDEEGDEQLS